MRTGDAQAEKLERAYERGRDRLLARRDSGEISEEERRAAEFKLEQETADRNTPERIARRWAREFSARMRTTLATLERGALESAFVSLAIFARDLLAPTEGGCSGLAALARGELARAATIAGGTKRGARPPRIPLPELEALQLRAREIKRANPRLSWEAIATRLLPELEKSKQLSVDRFARMLRPSTGEDSPAPAS